MKKKKPKLQKPILPQSKYKKNYKHISGKIARLHEWAKNNVIITAVAAVIIVPIIQSCSISAFEKSTSWFSQKLNPYSKEEEFLRSLKLNINVNKLLSDEKMYPVEKVVKGKTHQYLCLKNFILDMRTSPKGTLESYAVFSLNRYFHPVIPYLNEELGRKTFNDIEPLDNSHWKGTITRGSEYFEIALASRHTAYEPVWIGYFSYGIAEYSTKLESVTDLVPTANSPIEDSSNFRKVAIPNVYAYGGNYDTTDSKSDAIDSHDIHEILHLCTK